MYRALLCGYVLSTIPSTTVTTCCMIVCACLCGVTLRIRAICLIILQHRCMPVCASSPCGSVWSNHAIHHRDNILHACLCNVTGNELSSHTVSLRENMLHACLCRDSLRKHIVKPHRLLQWQAVHRNTVRTCENILHACLCRITLQKRITTCCMLVSAVKQS